MRRLNLTIFSLLTSLLMLAYSTPSSAQYGYDDDYSNYNDYNNYDDGYYNASYQDFYDGLAPYGRWIYDNNYGYVWMPNVGPDFRPYYTNGYWTMTQYGNTWVSNYAWGWAPFHYGRWTYDSYYGWLWIPGNEWAPAWVSWRSNNNYYGWAPMGPGVGINISLNLIPMDWWIFLSPTYFYSPNFYTYCNSDWRWNSNMYRQTNYVNYTYVDNRTVYYTGPNANDYNRRTGRRVSMYNITNNNRRGGTRVSGRNINIYRPRVQAKHNNISPRTVTPIDRNINRRPQRLATSPQPAGRQTVLRQSPLKTTPANPQRAREENTRTNTPARRDQTPNTNIERQRAQQQREQQVQQQRAQQQREQQVQQQRAQQQREQQVQQQRAQQQREQQVQQQRAQQQREQQMQQQRAQQQREQQMQQQRAQQQREQQMQQQRAQQQREQQMQQQRAQQQREQQMQQQRVQQQRNESKPRMGNSTERQNNFQRGNGSIHR